MLVGDLGMGTADTRASLTALTPREQQVFRLLAFGLTNRQIARRMGLAEKTVRNYVSEVLRKCNAQQRGQVIAMAAVLRERAH